MLPVVEFGRALGPPARAPSEHRKRGGEEISPAQGLKDPIKAGVAKGEVEQNRRGAKIQRSSRLICGPQAHMIFLGGS